MNDKNVEEKILKRIPLEILLLSFVLAPAVLAIFSHVSALLFLAGGGTSALSFIWLRTSLSGILQGEKKKALLRGTILYLLRFLLILCVFFTIILIFKSGILAFAAGFSALIPVLGGEAAAALIKAKQWKA
jgi:hypothetical protein